MSAIAFQSTALAQQEANAGTTRFRFTIAGTALASAQNLFWSVSPASGDPVDVADFAGGAFPSGTLTLPSGDSSSNIDVLVSGDTLVEADEGFQVLAYYFTPPPAGLIHSTTTYLYASGIILNDDTGYSIARLPDPFPSATNAARFIVTRAGDISRSASLAFAVSGAGATPALAADFATGLFPAGSLSFAAGAVSAIITVGGSDNALLSAGKGFAIAVNAPDGSVLASSNNAVPNTPVTIAGAIARQPTTDASSIRPFAGLTIVDPDQGQTQTVSVTMSSALDGIFSNLGAGTYDAAGGRYAVSGTSVAVTTAVNAITFTPKIHAALIGDAVTTRFTIRATDSLGAATADASTSVVATAAHTANALITAAGIEIRDGLTGDVVSTLPRLANGSMQFVYSDARLYGADLPSAVSRGLDPAQLRDYGGNDLGAVDGWLFKGLAAVRSASALSYVLVNPTNGRWAEVGVKSDGSINFANYGANGDTRVVGIYDDPLIALGVVAKGGQFDSQVRFLDDIRNDRLAVLGAADYDNNGFVDLFFKQTNHSADHHDDVYLRAILHLDGNIQYANYMTATQFTNWMTQAGTPASVYNNWLTQL